MTELVEPLAQVMAKLGVDRKAWWYTGRTAWTRSPCAHRPPSARSGTAGSQSYELTPEQFGYTEMR